MVERPPARPVNRCRQKPLRPTHGTLYTEPLTRSTPCASHRSHVATALLLPQHEPTLVAVGLVGIIPLSVSTSCSARSPAPQTRGGGSSRAGEQRWFLSRPTQRALPPRGWRPRDNCEHISIYCEAVHSRPHLQQGGDSATDAWPLRFRGRRRAMHAQPRSACMHAPGSAMRSHAHCGYPRRDAQPADARRAATCAMHVPGAAACSGWTLCRPEPGARGRYRGRDAARSTPRARGRRLLHTAHGFGACFAL